MTEPPQTHQKINPTCLQIYIQQMHAAVIELPNSKEKSCFLSALERGVKIKDMLFLFDAICERENCRIFSGLCQALRVAITGDIKSPPLFEIMEILGRDECMRRIEYAASR